MNVETAEWQSHAFEADANDERFVAVRRRQRIITAAAIILIVLIFAAVAMLMGRKDSSVPVTTSGVDGNAPHVTVMVPGRQQVAKLIRSTGTLAARRDMPVGVAGEGGMVTRVLVEAGDWVRAGQVLAVIERSVQAQEAEQLAAGIAVARADAVLAQQEVDRAQALISRGFISKADVQRRIAARDAANARVRVAQAQLGQTRAQIGRLDIRAPAAGLVLERNVEAGKVVGGGSGALFRIAQGGEMELLARLSQEDLARVTVGTPATVTPVGSNQNVQGSVWQVSPVIDPQSRQGDARIAIPFNKDLRPGGFASAEIRAGAVDAPLLPESAVQSDAQGNYVYIIDSQNKAERRKVQVGEISDAGVAIVGGINGSERVVVSAAGFLKPGDKVMPVRAVAPR